MTTLKVSARRCSLGNFLSRLYLVDNTQGVQHCVTAAERVLGRVHPALALVNELRTLLLQICTSCGASCALGSTT